MLYLLQSSFQKLSIARKLQIKNPCNQAVGGPLSCVGFLEYL